MGDSSPFDELVASKDCRLMWRVPILKTKEEIERAMREKEGVVYWNPKERLFGMVPHERYVSGRYQKLVSIATTKKNSVFKRKSVTTLDVVVTGGEYSKTHEDTEWPANIYMFVHTSTIDDSLVSIGCCAGLSEEDVEYLRAAGMVNHGDSFELEETLMAEVCADVTPDGFLRHPRILRWRSAEEGASVSTFAEVIH